MMKRISHTIGNQILSLKCGFSYGIGRTYRPIWVSVSVLELNQNIGFGRTLRKKWEHASSYQPNSYYFAYHGCSFNGENMGLGSVLVGKTQRVSYIDIFVYCTGLSSSTDLKFMTTKAKVNTPCINNKYQHHPLWFFLFKKGHS